VAGRLALVTGGAGFIGAHLVAGLLARGWRVRVLDDLSSGRREALPAHPALEVVTGDVRDAAALARTLAGVEVVFHQAALRSVPRSMEDPFAYHDVNVTGTLRLLLAARGAGVRRLVAASSSSVYGDQRALPLHEGLLPRPVSPYGATKLAAEHYCAAFARHYGLETVSLRYFNVFGPGQDPLAEHAAVVPRFILAARRGQPLEIQGDGEQTRDFVYVDNVVAANLAAAEAPGVAGEVFNVGAGTERSVLDVARGLEAILGRPLARRHVAPRPGDVRRTPADVTRARAGLGYAPAVDFAEGLRRTVAALPG
jgi:nucleoside-diphosphate-sugar epimerase